MAGRSAVNKSHTSKRIGALESPARVVFNAAKNAKIGRTVLPLEGAKVGAARNFGAL